MRDSKFDFEMSGIAGVLESRLLSVPRYQRSYAWGSNERDEEVVEFWGDFQSAFVQEGAEYFSVPLCSPMTIATTDLL